MGDGHDTGTILIVIAGRLSELIGDRRPAHGALRLRRRTGLFSSLTSPSHSGLIPRDADHPFLVSPATNGCLCETYQSVFCMWRRSSLLWIALTRR
jgi:hypothetical protein